MSIPTTALPLNHVGQLPRTLRMLRAAGIGSLAGLLGGVIWGLLARGAMRAIARAMSHSPSFTLEGTLAILIIGAMLGSLAGLLYGLLRDALPASRIYRGLILIALMEATIGLWIATGPLTEEGLPAVAPLGMALFGGSILIWGAVIEALFQPLDMRILKRGRSRLRIIVTSIALCIPALIALSMIAAQQLGLAAG